MKFAVILQDNTYTFRAVTLVGEKERKLLKEIVKRADNAVKSRVVPQGWSAFDLNHLITCNSFTATVTFH